MRKNLKDIFKKTKKVDIDTEKNTSLENKLTCKTEENKENSFSQKKLSASSVGLSFLFLFFVIQLIVYPEIYTKTILDGFKLFVFIVMPSLFPFLFFSKALSVVGFGEIGILFKRPLKALYNAPPCAGYLFVMSVLSGYPVGAKLLADAYENNLITHAQAKTISAFTSTSGFLFIIGAVGVGMFGDKKFGMILLISHFLSAVLNGLLYRNRSVACEEMLPAKQNQLLSNCIWDSMVSLMIVGGYIALFYMICEVLINIGLIGFIAYVFSGLFSLLHLPQSLAQPFSIGLFEITRGCSEIALLGLPHSQVLPLTAMLISFGGLCIIVQSLTFLSKCKIKASFVLTTKLTHAILTYALTALMCLIFL